MIKITRKEDCVGCNACVQRCPKHCISMHEDEQGFLYPVVDVSKCIECGLCERVCPVINQSEPRKPLSAYAARNTDVDIQESSSSGGVFYALAKSVIEEGGVVFGARFDEKWEVIHDYTETIEGIKAFQTSKYVQSRMGDNYLKAERFLKEGRKVLFSGTPCQIAGLRLFLSKGYDNLFAVDIVCHGVPSPLVWREYLNYITRASGASKNSESQPYPHPSNDIPLIKGISFRDKRLGWEKYGIAIHFAAPEGGRNTESQYTISQKEENPKDFFEPHSHNLFMQCFLKDLCLRPSCYSCPTKCGKSHSDITLADFWGIKKYYPELYYQKCISLILSNVSEDKVQINPLIIYTKISYEHALIGNPAIESSATKPKTYEEFWDSFIQDGVYEIGRIIKKMKPNILKRIIKKIRSRV